jgi:hypothetical protein
MWNQQEEDWLWNSLCWSRVRIKPSCSHMYFFYICLLRSFHVSSEHLFIFLVGTPSGLSKVLWWRQERFSHRGTEDGWWWCLPCPQAPASQAVAGAWLPAGAAAPNAIHHYVPLLPINFQPALDSEIHLLLFDILLNCVSYFIMLNVLAVEIMHKTDVQSCHGVKVWSWC